MGKALSFYANASHGAMGRQGCLIIGCATQLASFDEDVAKRVGNSLARSEAFMAELIRQGQADGSIPAHVDSDATARLMLCLVQCMRVVGKHACCRQDWQDTGRNGYGG